MNRIDIATPDDARVVEYTGLTDVALRRRTEPENGLYIAESGQVIRRVLSAGHRPRSFLMAPKWLDSMADVVGDAPVYVADEDVLRGITGFHLHRGALAAMHRPVLPSVDEVLAGARRVAVLEDIVDHTNVGALFRCAAGLDVDAVLVTPRCADPLYRRSIRVSMGTVFQVPWTRLDPWPGGLDQVRAAGFTVAAMALHDGAVSLDDLEAQLAAGTGPERLAMLLGTEGDGLTAKAVDLADLVVRIPMSGGVDSLNVAAAGGVVFWATRPR